MKSFLWTLFLISLTQLTFVSADNDKDQQQLLVDYVIKNRGPTVKGMKELLEQGADVNTVNASSQQSPLMAAILRGHANVVRFLLNNPDVDVTIAEKDGYTPAHGAAYQGRPEIMHMLHESGKINVKDDFHEDGFAPLHRACWGTEQRHTLTVKVLLDAGVDPNLQSKDGKTCAEMTTNEHTKELLEKYPTKDEGAEL